ncbi:hypothetical protein DID76_02665 [Candidatus Marinamargulisbacteria bacterium SCGC AG-414-C22]|nr:hypothetical protein DID76_02665 [Candidatus Marinamargulisbacteria bacterium SCGC AG-414-C22]
MLGLQIRWSINNQMGYLVIIVASLSFGFTGIFVTLMNTTIPVILLLRFAVPTLCSLSFVWKNKSLLLLKSKLFFMVSFIPFFLVLLQFVAFKLTSVALTATMVYLWPICHYLICVVKKDVQLSPLKVIFIVIALAGLVMLHFDPSYVLQASDIIGMMLAFGTAMGIAIHLYLVKHYCPQQSISDILYLNNCLGALVMLPFALPDLFQIDTISLFYGLCNGLGIGFIGFYIYYIGVKRIPSSVCALLSFFEIPSSLILAYLLLSQSISTVTILGIVLIIGSSFAIICTQLYKERQLHAN